MPCEEEEMTCSDLDPQTLKPCVMACYCVEGYVKAPNGECVRLEDCPKGNWDVLNDVYAKKEFYYVKFLLQCMTG